MTYRIIRPVSGTDANADANINADAGGSTIALPGLRPGELKTVKRCTKIEFRSIFYKALPKLTIIAPTHIGYLDDLISSYASFS